MEYKIVDSQNGKLLISENYKFIFDKRSGFFERWGARREDDPQFSPIGPELADIAITENGCSMGCHYCSPAGTLVNTQAGLSEIQHVRLGTKVIGYDFDKNTIREQEVQETYSRQYIGDIVEIEFDNNRILKLTPDHLVFLLSGKTRLAGELKEGDDVLSV